jgi:hypothetical protein
MARESRLIAGADLFLVYLICGYAFILDKLLDLSCDQYNLQSVHSRHTHEIESYGGSFADVGPRQHRYTVGGRHREMYPGRSLNQL